MSRITVKPGGPDRRVPVEGLRGIYFEADVPREVELTRYIQRRLADGDLVEVAPAAARPASPAPAAAVIATQQGKAD